MSIDIFHAQSRKAIKWAGGTSTEIFIYPAHTTFADRDFLFRISTATVDVEEADFTFFDGVTRHLMILKGELDLIHEGHYSKHLKQFEKDIFSGEWKTHSIGKVTDFNLMLKGSTTGSLKHFVLNRDAVMNFASGSEFYFLFIAEGVVNLNDGRKANSGDLIKLSRNSTLDVHANGQCDLIEIEVFL